MFIPFSTAVILAAVAAWWIATSLLSNTLEQRLSNQLTHTLDVLANSSFAFTPDLLAQLAQLQDMHFALIDPEGMVVFSTLTASDPRQAQRLAAIIQSTRQAGQSETSQAEFNLQIKPLSRQRSSQYSAIAGSASKSHVQAATISVALTLGGVSALTIALLAWWGHRISTSLTRPIDQLAQMARHIAQGERSQHAPATEIREIRILGQALDNMATSLDSFERELASSNRLQGLGELAARVAHEIRNPLTAIKLHLQMLAESEAAPAQQPTLQRVLDEAQRLELVVNSALSLGRPLTVDLQNVDLNRVVTDVTALVTAQFEHRNIELQTQVQQLPQAWLDPDRIKQVIFNLLTNAADALPQGGTIRVTTRLTADDNAIQLDIEDSGPGLPPGENLFTATQATTKLYGLGVGLIICKEIVDLHGGHIDSGTSEALQGARFSVTLPLLPPSNSR